MNEKLIREIGRSQRLEILTALRRRGGMSVKELAAHFDMSYMGIKQHCLDLEKEGYLETERRRKSVGRPEIIYKLAPRAFELFPGGNNELTLQVLEAIQQSYGPAVPAKLLFTIFSQRSEKYQAAGASANLANRAAALTKLRNAEGYMAELTDENGVAFVDDAMSDAAGSGDDNSRLVEPGSEYTAGATDVPLSGGGFRILPGAVSGGGNGHGASAAAAIAAGSARLRIIEHHSPIEDLLRRFPIIARLERELFERVLRCTVQREEQSEPGIYRCTFHLS